MEPKCVHCGERKQQPHKRGLCMRCYHTENVRRLYPLKNVSFDTRTEPTEDELERMIAEQMKCLPAWWPKDGQKDADE